MALGRPLSYCNVLFAYGFIFCFLFFRLSVMSFLGEGIFYCSIVVRNIKIYISSLQNVERDQVVPLVRF